MKKIQKKNSLNKFEKFTFKLKKNRKRNVMFFKHKLSRLLKKADFS